MVEIPEDGEFEISARFEFEDHATNKLAEIERQLTEFADKHLLGARSTQETAQATADAFVRIEGVESVVVEQPYSCPVRGCPHREPEGATCPIHLRDLLPLVFEATFQARLARPLTRIEQTVKVA